MLIRLISSSTIGRNRLILLMMILLINIALAVMTAAVTGARARRIESAPPAKQDRAAVQGQSKPERIEMEHNRSGLQDDLTFRLDRVGGNRLHEARLPKGRLGWRQLVDLPPGRYAVTEADHPDWVCSVTITAQ
jgi:hypothetical protein